MSAIQAKFCLLIETSFDQGITEWEAEAAAAAAAAAFPKISPWPVKKKTSSYTEQRLLVRN